MIEDITTTQVLESLDTTLDEARTQEIVEEFYRDGVVLVPQVLVREECAVLRRRTDDALARDDAPLSTSVLNAPIPKFSP